MSPENRPLLQAAVALVVATALAAASLAPPPSEGSAAGAVLYGVPHGDLLLHFVGYLALAAVAVGAVKRSEVASRGSRTGAAALGVVAFGAAVEVLQIGVPGRSFSTLDLAANAAGAAAGYLVVRYRWSDRRP